MSATGPAHVSQDVAGDGDGSHGVGNQAPHDGGWRGNQRWASWDTGAAATQQSSPGLQQWAPGDWHNIWWQGQWERQSTNSWAGYYDRQFNWPGYQWQPHAGAYQQAWGSVPEQEVQQETVPRRASVQSTTVTDQHSADQYEDAKESSDAGSHSKASPKTGKDYVPEYDGKSPMRDYEMLFESATGIDPGYRAQKLTERLSGAAWTATEGIDSQELKHEQGVQRLLKYLCQELELLEHLRVFSTLTEFYREFKRTAGQEFIEYDMLFRKHLTRLEDIGAKLEGLTKASGSWRQQASQQTFVNKSFLQRAVSMTMSSCGRL